MSFSTWASVFVDNVSTISAAFLNQIRVDIGRAIDGTGGGTYTPTAPITVSGAQGISVETLFVENGQVDTYCSVNPGAELEFIASSLCTFDSAAQLDLLDGSIVGIADGCVFVSAATFSFTGQTDLAPTIDDLTVPTASHRKEFARCKVASTIGGHIIASRASSELELTVNAGVDDTVGEYSKDSNSTAGNLRLGIDGKVTIGQRSTGSADFTTWDSEIKISPVATTSPAINTLIPGLIPKAWAYFTSDGFGSRTVHAQINVNNVTAAGVPALVTLLQPMASANYVVVATCATATARYTTVTITDEDQFSINAYDGAGASVSMATNAVGVYFVVFGLQ